MAWPATFVMNLDQLNQLCGKIDPLNPPRISLGAPIVLKGYTLAQLRQRQEQAQEARLGREDLPPPPSVEELARLINQGVEDPNRVDGAARADSEDQDRRGHGDPPENAEQPVEQVEEQVTAAPPAPVANTNNRKRRRPFNEPREEPTFAVPQMPSTSASYVPKKKKKRSSETALLAMDNVAVASTSARSTRAASRAESIAPSRSPTRERSVTPARRSQRQAATGVKHYADVSDEEEDNEDDFVIPAPAPEPAPDSPQPEQQVEAPAAPATPAARRSPAARGGSASPAQAPPVQMQLAQEQPQQPSSSSSQTQDPRPVSPAVVEPPRQYVTLGQMIKLRRIPIVFGNGQDGQFNWQEPILNEARARRNDPMPEVVRPPPRRVVRTRVRTVVRRVRVHRHNADVEQAPVNVAPIVDEPVPVLDRIDDLQENENDDDVIYEPPVLEMQINQGPVEMEEQAPQLVQEQAQPVRQRPIRPLELPTYGARVFIPPGRNLNWREWTVSDVRRWAANFISKEETLEKLQKEAIDGWCLETIPYDEKMLPAIQIPFGHFTKLKQHFYALQNAVNSRMYAEQMREFRRYQ